MSDICVRPGTPSDTEAAVKVWKASDTARRGGSQIPPEHERRARDHIENPDSFLLVAEDGDSVVGMACGMQGLADDGAGPEIPGLCHIGMVFVAPERWGEGVGGVLVDAALDEARLLGFERTQLWTHARNERARRLYERRGFEWSGREKEDDLDERIVHYERSL
jgi:GNAT superfamily N-acetyltransferase